MPEPLVVAALSLPADHQWQRLKAHVASVSAKSSAAAVSASSDSHVWQHGVASLPPRRRQRTRAAKGGRNCCGPVAVVVHRYHLDMSLGDFWLLHDLFRRSNATDRVATECIEAAARVVGASRHFYQWGSVLLPGGSPCRSKSSGGGEIPGGDGGAQQQSLCHASAKAMQRVAASCASALPKQSIFSDVLRGSWSQFAVASLRAGGGSSGTTDATAASSSGGGGGSSSSSSSSSNSSSPKSSSDGSTSAAAVAHASTEGHRAAAAVPALHVLWIQAADVLEEVGRAWAFRLNNLAQTRQALLHTNALISTLGGGYFMCRSIGQAVAMAEKQMLVARRLHDPVLAVKCRIHLAYNEMQLGEFDRARGTVQQVREHTAALGGDAELEGMALAAAAYLERLEKLARTAGGMQVAPESSVVDEFYRQRPVDEQGRLRVLLPAANDGGANAEAGGDVAGGAAGGGAAGSDNEEGGEGAGAGDDNDVAATAPADV